ncbi:MULTISPECIES: pitrilysin family protein [unclassified Thermosipho (in: thermotogales)]|uniref:M16 family metallopeptidase n=1 Tax=unclassified Thermosipho (in: thermotogales) TaxID=2676525 RepID=UPI0009C876AF|nr:MULTISPECIES: pitrilysin family protein [unclassified Thermosipho (in: thermotogales)]MBT1247835.1 peptidase M16 [Thermosipho sp. 1244]OOC45464.1 peptidase M16 [Thermosipho sp. 1223]
MEKMVLRNGIELYFYPVEGVRSATIAFNVGVGSVYEPEELSGISHFIEHLSFRGTKKYNMKELKLMVEEVGGMLNAWTDKENTVYYAKVPSSTLFDAFDALKEIVFYPNFKDEDLELERSIIYQEYLSHKEDPMSNLFDLMYQKGLRGPHSKTVIGTEETIKNISLDDIKRFHEEFYTPYNVKVIIVGYADRKVLDKIVNELEKVYGNFIRTMKHKSDINHGILEGKIIKNAKQVHILYVTKGFSLEEHERYPMIVLNTILSSGMSSYFFEEIREREGLVYDIFSTNLSQKNWGIFNIYAAVSLEKVEKFVRKMSEVIRNFKLTDDMFNYGKKRMIGKLELSTESTSTITNLIIEYLANDVTPELPIDIIKRIKTIQKKEIEDVFEKLFTQQWSLFYVSPEKLNNLNFRGEFF